VCARNARYGLPVRSGWWASQLEVEGLAALAAWADRYYPGEWDDPPAKLALPYDRERVARLLAAGDEDRRAASLTDARGCG
jgi:hypothetical protein